MRVILICGAFLLALCLLTGPAAAEVVYQEGFESGWGAWYADAGIWEIGAPTAVRQGPMKGQTVQGRCWAETIPPIRTAGSSVLR